MVPYLLRHYLDHQGHIWYHQPLFALDLKWAVVYTWAYATGPWTLRSSQCHIINVSPTIFGQESLIRGVNWGKSGLKCPIGVGQKRFFWLKHIYNKQQSVTASFCCSSTVSTAQRCSWMLVRAKWVTFKPSQDITTPQFDNMMVTWISSAPLQKHALPAADMWFWLLEPYLDQVAGRHSNMKQTVSVTQWVTQGRHTFVIIQKITLNSLSGLRTPLFWGVPAGTDSISCILNEILSLK